MQGCIAAQGALRLIGENGGRVLKQPLDNRIQMLVPVVQGLAAMLGPGCEVVLHDISRLPHSLVAIANGEITGRTVGDAPTDRMLRSLRSSDRSENVHLHISAHEGRVLKSLAVTLRDQEGEPFCLLGLTLDISDLDQAQRALANITRLSGASSEPNADKETTAGDIRDAVDGMINRIVGEMGKTPAAMSREEKMQVVKRLEEHGAFLVKRAAEQVAEALDLSRYTIFSYLKEIRRGDARKHADS